MLPKDIYDELTKGFTARKFSAGLLVAMIDLIVDLGVPGRGYESFDDLLADFPRQDKTAAGARANTLIVKKADGKTQSLRPYYNAIEMYYRATHKRFDYPSAAPHATQAWQDYIHWLNALVTFTVDELLDLRVMTNEFVLNSLPSQEFDPLSIDLDPPLFKLLLEDFDMIAVKGEPTGAAFQGIVFGFLRADNPHLQIEIDKVRTGSKRLQRVGDVDGWEGGRLAISAEVKQYTISDQGVSQLQAFGNETGRRGALGIVAALAFEDTARSEIEAIGLVPIDRAGLLNIVELWDPVKQRVAVSSFVYYTKHVEKNSNLITRLDTFLAQASENWMQSRKPPAT